ncbi:MAG: GNAT family N-acetyltransferase [Acidimicrobiia bacterium]
MHLRSYTESDALATLHLFLRAIREQASHDYSAEQIDAWAHDDRDLLEWHQTREQANTQVAEIDGHVIGFIDVATNGYIDMLYVDPAHGRTGIASALLNWAKETAMASGADRLSTHASITARQFFKAHEFVTEQECTPTVRGVAMTNYRMTLALN